jgi:hypothetical protein
MTDTAREAVQRVLDLEAEQVERLAGGRIPPPAVTSRLLRDPLAPPAPADTPDPRQ